MIVPNLNGVEIISRVLRSFISVKTYIKCSYISLILFLAHLSYCHYKNYECIYETKNTATGEYLCAVFSLYTHYKIWNSFKNSVKSF